MSNRGRSSDSPAQRDRPLPRQTGQPAELARPGSEEPGRSRYRPKSEAGPAQVPRNFPGWNPEQLLRRHRDPPRREGTGGRAEEKLEWPRSPSHHPPRGRAMGQELSTGRLPPRRRRRGWSGGQRAGPATRGTSRRRNHPATLVNQTSQQRGHASLHPEGAALPPLAGSSARKVAAASASCAEVRGHAVPQERSAGPQQAVIRRAVPRGSGLDLQKLKIRLDPSACGFVPASPTMQSTIRPVQTRNPID